MKLNKIKKCQKKFKILIFLIAPLNDFYSDANSEISYFEKYEIVLLLRVWNA